MGYNQAPSHEGYGDIQETLHSLQHDFQSSSIVALLKEFPHGTNTRTIEHAAEYMRQGGAFVGQLITAVGTGEVGTYRTLPQVDTRVGEATSHRLSLPDQEEHPGVRIYVEHTDFAFGHTRYYNKHVLIRHGLTRLRISTQHHVARDALSGGIVQDDSTLSVIYESFTSKLHVTAKDCRTDLEVPARQGRLDVQFGFSQEEQEWPNTPAGEQGELVRAAFQTACGKLQDVSGLLPGLPA